MITFYVHLLKVNQTFHTDCERLIQVRVRLRSSASDVFLVTCVMLLHCTDFS